MSTTPPALRLLPPGPTPAAGAAVRPITQQILGVTSPNNLIAQVIPSVEVIAESAFRAGVASNKPSFRSVSPTTRASRHFRGAERQHPARRHLAVASHRRPRSRDHLITQGFGQDTATLDPLNWGDPLSTALINFVLLKDVVNRWDPQTLASRKQMVMALYALDPAPTVVTAQLPGVVRSNF
jgi:hypothetical protein